MLVDLVLPVRCAGCGGAGRDWCARCAGEVRTVPAGRAVPDPVPAGLPPVFAVGPYQGPLGPAVVAYKDRGRHRLAGVLGRYLATAVAAAAGAEGSGGGWPVLLVPVPATAAAARRRYGDHMVRLARHAAAALRVAGVPAAVARPLRAGRRPDSAGLTAAQRHRAAAAFAVRPGRLPAVRRAARAGVRVVVLDDVMTTGATLAAVSALLRAAGVPVRGAAVLAATRRRCQ